MSPRQLRAAVVNGLLEGYGAEDIAVRGGLSIKAVRFVMRALEVEGRMAGIVAEARQRWREGSP